MRQLLLEEGIPDHVLNNWVEAADHELDTTKFRNWARIRYAWGQTHSPDNIPIPTYDLSQTYRPSEEKYYMDVPPVPMSNYDGPVAGLWDPPRPRLQYQQFKCKTKEEAARYVERREELVRAREILIDAPRRTNQPSS